MEKIKLQLSLWKNLFYDINRLSIILGNECILVINFFIGYRNLLNLDDLIQNRF